jgi:tetraacyldisaccharide 4'-kinase
MLAALHPRVPFFVCGDRLQAAHLARYADAPRLLVLDDAYQHLRARRDLNVLLVDAQAGFGSGLMLPLGPLREPLREVRRADVALITKANLGTPDKALETLRAAGFTGPAFRCDYRATHTVRLDGQARQPADALRGQKVHLLSGIARPEAFRATVEALGTTVTGVEAHPDHFAYPAAAVQDLTSQLTPGGTTDPPRWLTTEKDAVKLRGRLSPEAAQRLWVLAMEAVPEPPARAFFLDRIRALALH